MITDRIKAYIALLGSIVVALLGLDIIPTDSSIRTWLTVAAAVITAILTYTVPNSPRPVVDSTGKWQQ